MNITLNKYFQSNLGGYSISQTRKNLQVHADKKALTIFCEAAKRVPAYKDFLKKNGVNPDKIKTIQDFKKYVPYTSKENYIFAYDLISRCWDGKLNNAHTFAASSGSTGEPIFWPREIEQEVEGAKIHEYLFDKVYDVKNKKTLFINSFGLGNWIAGMYTEMCLYLSKLHGFPFTLASPGYNQEETYKIIKNFSKYYDQTILACHPPILKMMIENGIQENIDWKGLNIKFLGAGEGFSENWRDYLLSLVGQKDKLRTILNIYGSADAGLMGFETPLSIFLHRFSAQNHDLNHAIFQSDRSPYLYQFDPSVRYLEQSASQEILVTMNATMPLLRYNIHDHGGIISANKLISVVRDKTPDFEHGIRKEKLDVEEWPFPFVYIFGRDKFMTSLYGVNIYPENIKSVIEHTSMQPYLTGRFITSKESDSKQDAYLLLRVELKPEVKPSTTLAKEVKRLFVSTVKKLNSEYNQVEDKYKDKMHPRIEFNTFQDSTYFPEGQIKKMA